MNEELLSELLLLKAEQLLVIAELEELKGLVNEGEEWKINEGKK